MSENRARLENPLDVFFELANPFVFAPTSRLWLRTSRDIWGSNAGGSFPPRVRCRECNVNLEVIHFLESVGKGLIDGRTYTILEQRSDFICHGCKPPAPVDLHSEVRQDGKRRFFMRIRSLRHETGQPVALWDKRGHFWSAVKERGLRMMDKHEQGEATMRFQPYKKRSGDVDGAAPSEERA